MLGRTMSDVLERPDVADRACRAWQSIVWRFVVGFLACSFFCSQLLLPRAQICACGGGKVYRCEQRGVSGHLGLFMWVLCLFLRFLHLHWLQDRIPLGTLYWEEMNMYYGSFTEPVHVMYHLRVSPGKGIMLLHSKHICRLQCPRNFFLKHTDCEQGTRRSTETSNCLFDLVSDLCSIIAKMLQNHERRVLVLHFIFSSWHPLPRIQSTLKAVLLGEST